MNVDKKKDRPFFNDRSNQVVFRFAGNFCQILSAVCSPYCLCCSISVRLSPSCRMLSGRWKSWVSGSNPGGMQSGFSPYTAHFTIRRECPATASVHPFPPPRRTLVRRDGEIFQRTSQPFAGGGLASHFSYQAVDRTLTPLFLRATLELPTGQYWPRGNFCLGGSLCRKLKKKR